MTQGEPHTDREGTLTLLKQLPRSIVDRNNVIRVHPVTQSESEGEDSESREQGGQLAYDNGCREASEGGDAQR
jgi:hypothetical protein